MAFPGITIVQTSSASAVAFRWACFFTLSKNVLLNISGGGGGTRPVNPLKYGPAKNNRSVVALLAVRRDLVDGTRTQVKDVDCGSISLTKLVATATSLEGSRD